LELPSGKLSAWLKSDRESTVRPFSIVTHRTRLSLCLRASLSSATVHRCTVQWPRPGNKATRKPRTVPHICTRVRHTLFQQRPLVSRNLPLNPTFIPKPTHRLSRSQPLCSPKFAPQAPLPLRIQPALPHASKPPTLLTPPYFPDRQNALSPHQTVHNPTSLQAHTRNSR
jgi:hypothetical protein